MEWMSTQRAVMRHPPQGAAQTLFLRYQPGAQPTGTPDCVRESTAPLGIYCEAEMTANSGDQYFWDHRNGATRSFFAETVAMGPSAMGSSAIDGLYLDDTLGLDEEHPHAPVRMKMTREQVTEVAAATREAVNQTIALLLPAGKYLWQMFHTAALPSRKGCAAAFRAVCAESRKGKGGDPTLYEGVHAALLMTLDSSVMNDTTHELSEDFPQAVAAFLILRPSHGFLNFGMWGWGNRPVYPAILDADVGVPLGVCTEVMPGVFARNYSRGLAKVNCDKFTATIPGWKSDDDRRWHWANNVASAAKKKAWWSAFDDCMTICGDEALCRPGKAMWYAIPSPYLQLKSDDSQEPRWFMGSFGTCGLQQQQQINPWNATALNISQTFRGATLNTCATGADLVKVHQLSNGKMRGFLNLGFSYAMNSAGQMADAGGYFIYNHSCKPMPGGVALRSCGGYSGLQSSWKARVHQDIAAIGPALKNGSIAGVYLGDEIVETARIPWADYAALVTELKAAMAVYGGGLVYGNEGAWYNLGQYAAGGPCPPALASGCNASQCYEEPCTGFTWFNPPQFPDGLDLFSFDNYVPISCNQSETCSGVKPATCKTLRSAGMKHWNLSFSGPCSEDPAEESRRTREIYEKLLYPKMRPHQRLLIVPGLFADAELANNRSGSLTEQDDFMVAKLKAYRQWMREDEKIAGLWGWHWGAEPIKQTLHAGYTIGTSRLPKTILYLEDMAKEIKPIPKKPALKADDTTTCIVKCTNKTDCTAELQAALYDTTAHHVIVPHTGRPYNTLPLKINRSNLVLTLQPGVVIQAKRAAFQKGVLLEASGAHNLMIRGEGASLRMWRADYANASLYTHSEFRMGLSFYYCHNVSVSGLEIAETGGDGIYIQGIIGGVIRNVTTDGAFRNGLSIIYAVDLLVENCTFRATGGQGKYNGGELLTPANGGTAPRAGVDTEPDGADDVLINVTLRAFTCLPAVEMLVQVFSCLPPVELLLV